MCRTVSRKVTDNHWVPNHPLVLDDPLIPDNRQGEMCRVVSGKVPDDCWVPDDLLVLDDQLICDDRQGRAYRVVSVPFVIDNTFGDRKFFW